MALRWRRGRTGISAVSAMSMVAVCLLLLGAGAAAMQPAIAQTSSQHEARFTLYAPGGNEGFGIAYVSARNSTSLLWDLYISSDFRLSETGQYSVVMLVNGTTHALGNLTISPEGNVGTSGSMSLAPGIYGIGIDVLNGTAVLLEGMPSPQYLTLGTSTTVTSVTTTYTRTETTESTNAVSSSINSVRFDLAMPGVNNESYGIAAVGVYPSNSTRLLFYVEIRPSAQLSENGNYTVVLTVNGTSYSVGGLKVFSQGGGSFSGSLSLPPGSYHAYVLGIEVLSGSAVSLVGEPTPQTLVLAPASTGGGIPPIITYPLGFDRFAFFPPNQSGTPYGEAGVGLSNATTILVYLGVYGIAHLSTSAQYTVELTVNGTSYNVGSLKVTNEGAGSFYGRLRLPSGNYSSYLVGIEILSGSTVTLVGQPTPQVLTPRHNEGGGGVPPPTVYPPGIDRFVLYPPGETMTAYGQAGVGAYNSTTILVSLGVYSIAHLSTSTQYTVVITLNGTTYDVATLRVNDEGGGSAFGSVKAPAGAYSVQLQIVANGTAFLTGEPSPQILRLGEGHNPGGGPPGEGINTVKFSLNSPGGSVAYGVADLAVTSENSGQVRFEVLVYQSAGLSPGTKYGVVVSVNGTTYTGGTLTITGQGTGQADGYVQLPAGHYESYSVGIEILSGASVLYVGQPTPQTLVFRPQHQGGGGSNGLSFTFQAVDGSGVKGKAAVLPQGTDLRIYATFGNLTANAQYTLELIANGTAHQVGTLVFGDNANVQMETDVSLSPGTWQVGFVLQAGGITVLQSDPVAARVVLNGQTSAGTAPSAAPSSTAIGASESVVHSIDQAKIDGTIPVVVQVSGNSTSAAVLSSQFSVSLGQASNGVLVTITGTNVDGSRVLLVNFSQPIDLQTKALSVTLDNQTVAEASSLTQLFGSLAEPLFVVVSTSSGTQLLIGIPHFSTHVIQISQLPLLQALSFVADARVLLAAVLVVTAVFAALYARRERAVVVP